jgi:hypothetical protein
MKMDISKLKMDEVEMLVERLNRSHITAAIKRMGSKLMLEVNDKATPLLSTPTQLLEVEQINY